VQEALQRLERELALARKEGLGLLKIIHGYGSTGVGGDIRIAVQVRLREMVEDGRIRAASSEKSGGRAVRMCGGCCGRSRN